MFQRKLELVFVVVIILAFAILALNYYRSYTFKHNDIPLKYQRAIKEKEREVLSLMKQHYGYSLKFPIIVTDKFQSRVYGLTTYRDGRIEIYLNKNVMKESMNYILSSVIAHEYAHALMFKNGHLDSKKDGHSALWKETCVNLGGKDCQCYVDREEVILSKLPFQ